MDTTLQALVEAAERGDDVPRVSVAVGSGVVSGIPIPHSEYAELQRESIEIDLRQVRRPRIRGERKADIEASVAESAGIAAFAQTPPSGSALVLKEVAFLLGTGEAVRARSDNERLQPRRACSSPPSRCCGHKAREALVNAAKEGGLHLPLYV